jgi:ferredoxin
MPLKATVDHDLCEGHSRCQSAAPEVFEVRDDDKSYVLMDKIPEELRDKVERAARLCPRQAITVEELA